MAVLRPNELPGRTAGVVGVVFFLLSTVNQGSIIFFRLSYVGRGRIRRNVGF